MFCFASETLAGNQTKHKAWTSGEVYMGSPAFEAGKYRKAYIHFRNLDALVQRVDKLERGIRGKEGYGMDCVAAFEVIAMYLINNNYMCLVSQA